MPGEGGALDAAGELANAGEDGQLAEAVAGGVDRRRGLAGEHGVDAMKQGLGLVQRFADHAGRHHRGRGFGDGAALALECGVLDHAILHAQIEPDLVPTERVVALGGPVGALQHAEVPRLPVVVENHLLVEVAEIGHQPKISRARSIAATSVSSSPRVL